MIAEMIKEMIEEVKHATEPLHSFKEVKCHVRKSQYAYLVENWGNLNLPLFEMCKQLMITPKKIFFLVNLIFPKVALIERQVFDLLHHFNMKTLPEDKYHTLLEQLSSLQYSYRSFRDTYWYIYYLLHLPYYGNYKISMESLIEYLLGLGYTQTGHTKEYQKKIQGDLIITLSSNPEHHKTMQDLFRGVPHREIVEKILNVLNAEFERKISKDNIVELTNFILESQNSSKFSYTAWRFYYYCQLSCVDSLNYDSFRHYLENQGVTGLRPIQLMKIKLEITDHFGALCSVKRLMQKSFNDFCKAHSTLMTPRVKTLVRAVINCKFWSGKLQCSVAAIVYYCFKKYKRLVPKKHWMTQKQVANAFHCENSTIRVRKEFVLHAIRAVEKKLKPKIGFYRV